MIKKQPYSNLYLKRVAVLLVLFFASYHSLAQNTPNADSSTKKQTTLPSDTGHKPGYAKITLLGHTRIVKLPALQDSDGDGVPDQLDLEPNTQQGAEVDTHGRALDTDGDGVPDYKDKERLTQQSCFPVNKDGIGMCSEPVSCKETRRALDSIDEEMKGDPFFRQRCKIDTLPSILFKKGTIELSKNAKLILLSVASRLQANPYCNVEVVGCVADNITTLNKQRSWHMVNAVIKYLIEKAEISESRVIFVYGQPDSSDRVDLIPTTETGPASIPYPRFKH